MTGDRFRLDGKVVAITGASSGLGVAFAVACAHAGASVVVAARRTERLRATVASIEAAGQAGHAVAADVSESEDCRRIVDEAVRACGRLDVLVNNAGTTDPGPATRITPETYRRVMDTNLASCLWTSQAAAKVMEPGSTIINVASVLAVTTIDAPATAYSMSKAGLLGLSRSLARQWTGRKGIRVNTLLPGFFPSEISGADDHEREASRFLMGRVGDPSELADALVFLASDASSYMTGAELVVDGGFAIT